MHSNHTINARINIGMQGTTHSPLSHPGGATEAQAVDGNGYNRCLTAVERECVKQSKKKLWARYLNATNFKNDIKLKWILETPYDVRDEAMNDLLKGYSYNFVTNHRRFEMKFRSEKHRHQSITVLSKHWGRPMVSSRSSAG